jgi:hypothetical protein
MNATTYDPVLKHSATTVQPNPPISLKCPEQKCIHYVYGFGSRESLEHHQEQEHASGHGSLTPRALSPRSSFLRTHGSLRQLPSHDFQQREDSVMSGVPDSHRPASIIQSLMERTPSISQSLSRSTSVNSRSSNRTYSFVPEYQSSENSLDLQDKLDNISRRPSKRTRLGADLDEETRLVREVGPCLRCKILKKKAYFPPPPSSSYC